MADAAMEAVRTLVMVAPCDQATSRGAIFGGWIMSQLDHAAGLAGRKLARGDVIIASVRELTFRGPLHPGEEFVISSAVTRRGNTSLTLALRGTAEPDGPARAVFDAEVVLVAVDSDGRPRKLP